ncbi:tetratricopeptide repeat protein [Luteitalea pratensis]|uniref:Tetratricopeptide repeat protein n=2 Tax=Luteitalea pratensis TaxID=1855912 RepID=A0A143PR48_LUTPR|nr:tetratricopeptide repeat protein [Luteitalea pratensis]
MVAAVVLLGVAGGCGSPVLPPVLAPGSERYPDYPKPGLTPDLARQQALAQQHERAWVQLQSGDPRSAERTLRELLKKVPGAYPSQAALGFARLAQDQPADALQWFDRVLQAETGYVPALVGRAEALVELGREGDAFESYQAVLERMPDQPVALRRAEVLRFRAVQSDVSAAQAALSGNRLEEARDHYGRALKASPDSGFLHRDLADVERRLGNTARARGLVDRALVLDPLDARAHALRGALADTSGDTTAALTDYRRALELDPALSELSKRITEIETGLEEAALPAEFKAIGSTLRVTRGETAALLAYRIPALLQDSARGTVLITDSRRHWAQASILLAARAGAMEVYPNHTFQPSAGMNRGDFAAVVTRVLNLVAARTPEAAQRWQDARLTFADVRPGHTLYLAISRAVASGVMQPVEGQTFGISRPMTGAEAVAAVDRLTRLAGQAGRGGGGAGQRGGRRE